MKASQLHRALGSFPVPPLAEVLCDLSGTLYRIDQFKIEYPETDHAPVTIILTLKAHRP